MKLIRFTFSVLLISLLFSTTLSAQTNFRIIDPRGWGWDYPGGISEATLAVQPRGLFMQYEKFLTFVIQPGAAAPFDSLEVEYFFELPEGAIVYDSWLWIEDYISYGIIMDADSASQVYEAIVNRRTDPSILLKRSATSYELRIFPITVDEPRKVKISYLLPMNWNQNEVLATLPVADINQYLQATSINLIVRHDSTWQVQEIPEAPGQVFVSKQDSISGPYLETVLTHVEPFNLTLSLSSPMDSGQYVGYFPTGLDEGIYQAAIQPSEFMDSIPPEKILLLLDFDNDNSVPAVTIRSHIRDIVKAHIGPIDSFNLMISTGSGILAASTNWLSGGDTALVDSILNPMAYTTSYESDLLNLLGDGLQFMAAHGNEGSIILFTSNNEFLTRSSAEALYDTLTTSGPILVPIHVADYQNKNFAYRWIWNPRGFSGYQVKTGNYYLYDLLAGRSGGSHISLPQSGLSLYQTLKLAFLTAKGKLEPVDFYTDVQAGFCFNRHQIAGRVGEQLVHQAMMQTGRYVGNFPLHVELAGLYKQELFSEMHDFDQMDMTPLDIFAQVSWAGTHIQALENGNPGTGLKQEIISQSIQNRVLSLYTAFLCLEDSTQRGLIDHNVIVIGNNDHLLDENEIVLMAFPNPFRDQVTLQIEPLSIDNLEDLNLTVYDLNGRVVFSFQLKGMQTDGETLKIKWDGRDLHGHELPGGIYALTLEGPGIREIFRIVKM